MLNKGANELLVRLSENEDKDFVISGLLLLLL